MESIISARRTHLSTSMKLFILEKLDYLNSISEKIVSSRVVVDATETRGYRVGLIAHVPGRELYAHGEAETLGDAINRVIDRLTRQLVKVSGKRMDHRSYTA